ncbi:MAG: thymidylate kinase [Clostridia bacterium]|nr:thymidylate kinase [Clostridia bacterium]
MQGKLIVLDGIDGSGKSTQFRLLTERLENDGLPIKKLVFPRYGEPSSALIKSYLAGDFGKNPGDVSPYAASTFFFVDRYASFKSDWGGFYKNGGTIICDRYTTSNAIHQTAKLPVKEQEAFLDWLYDFEFRLMELPKPDLVLYMDIDLKTCISQMKLRQKRTNTSGDIHETHADYLAACLSAGDLAAIKLGWHRVRCLENGVMRSVEEIGNDIYDFVRKVL